MPALRLQTDRLDLQPLPGLVAAALPDDRETARRALGAELDPEWPDPNLHGVLRRQAEQPAGTECFGVWVMIERASGTVVGDIGFHGPPDGAGMVEIGYSVVPRSRRLGYATEAATALVAWARSQPSIHTVVAGCDPDNEPSIRILERVGFRRTGEASGELRWRHESHDPDPTRL
jgi:[ribosomal protein S5]-alanine N-acetyltransferase